VTHGSNLYRGPCPASIDVSSLKRAPRGRTRRRLRQGYARREVEPT
jgi:hypothetical protein